VFPRSRSARGNITHGFSTLEYFTLRASYQISKTPRIQADFVIRHRHHDLARVVDPGSLAKRFCGYYVIFRVSTAQSIIFVDQSIALTWQTNPRDLSKAVSRICE